MVIEPRCGPLRAGLVARADQGEALRVRQHRIPAIIAVALAVACGASSSSPAPRPALPTRPTADQQASADRLLTGPDWYRNAVFYEVNVRSFQDSNGDGIGDLAGLVQRLDYLKELGVDALWLMPIYPTAFKDSGYDIADYRSINAEYGDMAAFEKLVAEAHARKMRVFMDLVLNHTSDKHAWFQESRSSKTNPKADWYVWSDTASRADIGSCTSGTPAVFGPSWSLDPMRGQYFFHRYYPEQPDLNYRNADVVRETLDVARFWLKDENVDGYRCDVIGQLFESPDGCTMIPETVAYIQKLRAVLDEMPEKAMASEPSNLNDSTAYFGNGSNMFHMSFEFGFGYFWGLAFSATDKKLIEDSIKKTMTYPKGSQPGQLIGSHDGVRAWQAAAAETWRYRSGALLSMTMRGTPFIYYGEEVGLRPGTQVVVDSRDSARTPMTWTRGAAHGFTTGTPWLAFGEAPDDTSVEAEDSDPESMLTYYRQLLAFRRGHAVWGVGDMRAVSLDSAQIVAFVREDASERYFVAVNMTDEDQTGSATDPLAGSATAVFGDGELAISGGSVHVTLPARGAAVFQIR